MANVQRIQRPWEPSKKQGTRYNPNPKYQGRQWRKTREAFRATYTLVNGQQVRNIFCLECFKKKGKLVPGKNTDHIEGVKQGGTDEFSNLQTLCDPCHARKSANEGKKK